MQGGVDRDQARAAVVLQHWCVYLGARRRVVVLAQELWRKVYDEERCGYQYENTRTGEVLLRKPYMLLGDADAPDDLDVKREQAAQLPPKQRLLMEYKIERQQRERETKLKRRARSDHKASLIAPAAKGVPDAPLRLNCYAGDSCAYVWWRPPARDNGNPVIAYVLKHYRLDAGDRQEWEYKGEDRVDALSDVVSGGVVTEVRVPHLKNLCSYRFTVCAVNEKGRGPFSAPSDTVLPTQALPETWLAARDMASGQQYFYNKVTGAAQWISPLKDPFYTTNSHFVALTATEREGLRRLWQEFDPTHTGEIDAKSQIDPIILRLGEIVIDIQRDRLLDTFCAPRPARPGGGGPVVRWDEFLGIVVELKLRKGCEELQPLQLWKILYRKFRDWRHEKRRPKVDANLKHLLEIRDSDKQHDKRWGVWNRVRDDVICDGRDFYLNSATGERRWTLPPEVMFYLPKALARKMRRQFSPDEFEQVKQVFQSFDINHIGRLDEHSCRVALDMLGEAAECSAGGDADSYSKLQTRDMRKLYEEVDLEGEEELLEFDQFCVMVLACEHARRYRGAKLCRCRGRRRKKGQGGFALTLPGGTSMSMMRLGRGAKVGVTDGGEGARGGEYSEEYSDDEGEAPPPTRPPLRAPKPKKPKRLTRRQRRELEKFPHGRECFCGCRTGTLEGKKKKERGAYYVLDDGKWRRKKKGWLCF